jgi:hypothetical protein
MSTYRKPNLKALQAECDRFNAKCPVGGAVSVTLDLGPAIETVTTSEAQVLSGHSAVVWMRDVRGCYDLDRVKPILSKSPVSGQSVQHGSGE